MGRHLEAESLRSLCAAVAVCDFDRFNRIKAIAQIAHEYLGTSSIVVYEFNRFTRQLDILAMPGVTQRELMRGPTDKAMFRWEKAESDHGCNGVWLENHEEHECYIRQLMSSGGTPSDSRSMGQQGTFRERELRKHQEDGGQKGRLATAKVYLWKGVGQTHDEVGQVFFNYYAVDSDTVFDDLTRDLIRFVCTLIRELLIEQLYHTDLPSAHSSPERLLRQINLAFDTSITDDTSANLAMESQVASIVCDAASHATENLGGHADLVYLIGERLAYVFQGQLGQAV